MTISIVSKIMGKDITSAIIDKTIIDTINSKFYKNGIFQIDKFDNEIHATMLDIATKLKINVYLTENYNNNGKDQYVFSDY